LFIITWDEQVNGKDVHQLFLFSLLDLNGNFCFHVCTVCFDFCDELLCNNHRTKGRKKGNKRLAHRNCRSFIRVDLSRKQVQSSTMSRLLIGSSNVYRSYRVLTFNKFPEYTMIRFVYNKSFKIEIE